MIEATPETTLDGFMQCLKALEQDHKARGCFRHFVLCPSNSAPPHRATPSENTLADILRPLCVFHQMETLSLSLPLCWGVLLTHASIERLVSSWPNLLTLRVQLEPECHWCNTASTTLTDFDERTLVMIAECCPKLKVLSIMFHVLRFGLCPSLDNRPHVWSHPLQELQLTGLQLESMDADKMELWATFLDCLFPNLTPIEPSRVPCPTDFPYSVVALSMGILQQARIASSLVDST